MKAETTKKTPTPAEAPITVVKRRMRNMVQLWHDHDGAEPRFLVAIVIPGDRARKIKGGTFFAEIGALQEVIDDFQSVIKAKTGKK